MHPVNAPSADLLAAPALADVITEISPLDSMLDGENREHYFSVGRSALRCIRLAMVAAEKTNCRRILDFGCGFGRVTRVLRAAFPQAELVACDISPESVDFCAATFNAEPLYSDVSPGAVTSGGAFDLIWCGTLLTNLDGGKIRRWLDWFRSRLVPGGLLVFTVHGPFVAERLRGLDFDYGLDRERIPEMLRNYDAAGFGYVDYPRDVLDRVGLEEYGVSICKPSWLCRQLEDVCDLRLVAYTETAWDRHQDSIGCVRE